MGVVVNPVISILYDANGVAMAVQVGAAIPGSTPAIMVAGSDGTNARYMRVAADGTVRIDPTGTTTQPISAASLPLPAGAATAALQTQPGVDIGDVTVNNGTAGAAVNIQDGGNSITVDATSWPLPTGAATEATLLTMLTLAGFQARINTLGQKNMANSTPFVIASDQTVIPISDNSGSLTVDATSWPLPTGAATSALQTTGNTSLNNIDTKMPAQGQATMSASTPVVIASNQSAVASKNAAASQDDGHSASIGATADADTALTVIGRLKQIITRLAGGLPAALVGGRLNQNMGSWFGSTVPTVGQKVMAQSIPVCMPTDQTAVLVTFTGTRTGAVGSIVSLGGSTAGILQTMRATAYTEQGSQAQRSFKSNNVNDTSAGTGARTVKFIYYSNTGAGPFTETVTLNGTTAVATVATDIRFIESMEVVTSGSGGANAGTITMSVNNAGGGGTIGSIGVSSIVTGVGDNKTLWAHHYVAVGVIASLSTLIVGAQSSGSGTSARFFVKAQSVLTANATETLVGDVLLVQGAFSRLFNFYVKVTGFSRLTVYAVPSNNNATLSAAFDYSET